MNRILFKINYDIHPEKRDEYISTMKELEKYIKDNTNHNYMVVEDKSHKNNFSEIYICKDEAEFEGLEDEMDDTIYGLTTKILTEYVVDGKTKYSTFYELN
jgi:quinol monooxygenase YgiN